MIQDIAPHRLDNAFQRAEAEKEHTAMTFHKGKVLVSRTGDSPSLPALRQLPGEIEELKKKAVYLFSIDGEPVFLIPERELKGELEGELEYADIRELNKAKRRWEAFAGATAGHLNHWYEEHRFCGCCGSRTAPSQRERAMICTKCGNIQYPRISPVIMAAVTDGERLLVTRYAGRPYKGLALIAGFVEIGESLEGALEREVMEEVGLKVKDLRYFGSQPWGFSDSIISGFFARLDGSSQIRLDRDELSEAVWLSKDELPPQKTDISITSAMIEAFRTGTINL